MNFGASTGCFFPMETLSSVKQLAQLNVKRIELFFNTESELTIEYLNSIKKVIDENNMQVISVHPYTSAIETFYFFSRYDYKLNDAIKMYEKYFIACKILNCKYVVFHGCFNGCRYMTIERYIKNLNQLSQRAREYHVYISQENVVEYKCGKINNIKKLNALADNDIKFCFDIKQAIRAKQDIYKILEVIKKRLSHVHISDYTLQEDSLLPFEGVFDYKKFFDYIESNSSVDTAIIEVYNSNIKYPKQIIEAIKKLEDIK